MIFSADNLKRDAALVASDKSVWQNSHAQVGCVKPKGTNIAGYLNHDTVHSVLMTGVAKGGNLRTNRRKKLSMCNQGTMITEQNTYKRVQNTSSVIYEIPCFTGSWRNSLKNAKKKTRTPAQLPVSRHCFERGGRKILLCERPRR